VLANTPGINFTIFDDRDVVRHRLVQRIILAYEAFNRGETDPASSASESDGAE